MRTASQIKTLKSVRNKAGTSKKEYFQGSKEGKCFANMSAKEELLKYF